MSAPLSVGVREERDMLSKVDVVKELVKVLSESLHVYDVVRPVIMISSLSCLPTAWGIQVRMQVVIAWIVHLSAITLESFST